MEEFTLLESEPKKVRGQHYDIVLGNGTWWGEYIHQPDVQKKIFEDVLNIPADVVKPIWLHVGIFEYGAPPGGIALRRKQLVTILAGKETVRDVIAFPKPRRDKI